MTAESEVARPCAPQPLRPWELAAYRASSEHAGHGCPNDPRSPAAVRSRARAYARNLRARLMAAAQARLTRIAGEWAGHYGQDGMERQERWERGARPSGGFRLGLIDAATREWPYDALRASAVERGEREPGRERDERAPVAVLRRLKRSRGECIQCPAGDSQLPEDEPELPDPRDINTRALAWHIVDEMGSGARRRRLEELLAGDLQDGYDDFGLIEHEGAGPEYAAAAAAAVAVSSEREIAQALVEVLQEKLTHDASAVYEFVSRAAAAEGVAEPAWLAGHLGWPGAPAACTARCGTCSGE